MQKEPLHILIEPRATGMGGHEFHKVVKGEALEPKSEGVVFQGMGQAQELGVLDVQSLPGQSGTAHGHDHGPGGLVHIGHIPGVGLVRGHAHVHIGSKLLEKGVVFHVMLEYAGGRVAGDVPGPVHVDREPLAPAFFQEYFGHELGAYIQIACFLAQVGVEFREKQLAAVLDLSRSYGCGGDVVQ